MSSRTESIAKYYGVHSLPTLMVFKDGEMTARKTGYMDGNTLREFVDK